jgi:hypothetical protein
VSLDRRPIMKLNDADVKIKQTLSTIWLNFET